MIRNEEMEKINKGLLPLNIIWAAMLISLFVYLLVGLFIEDNLHATTEKGVINVLRNVLFAVSFITLIATRFVRRLILFGTGRSTVIGADQSSYQGDQRTALSKYTAATVVSLAMTESIGTYGLVLFILGKNQLDLYLFVLISSATMLVYRPKRDEIVSLTRDFNRQSPSDSFQKKW
jgi:uncharacterized membrane protein YqgA involved in biofilm formation